MPGATFFTIDAGHTIEGASLSTTVTVNEQLALLPAASVPVTTTGVAPGEKSEPDAGLLVMMVEQASIGVGNANVTGAGQVPGMVVFMICAGHKNAGGVLSTTVTVAVASRPRRTGFNVVPTGSSPALIRSATDTPCRCGLRRPLFEAGLERGRGTDEQDADHHRHVRQCVAGRNCRHPSTRDHERRQPVHRPEPRAVRDGSLEGEPGHPRPLSESDNRRRPGRALPASAPRPTMRATSTRTIAAVRA